MPKLENGGYIRQASQLQASEVPHGFDLVQSIVHRRIAEVLKELHAVNPQHGRHRVLWSAVMALGIVASHLLLQLLQGISLSIRSRKISRRVLRFLFWYSASEKVSSSMVGVNPVWLAMALLSLILESYSEVP